MSKEKISRMFKAMEADEQLKKFYRDGTFLDETTVSESPSVMSYGASFAVHKSQKQKQLEAQGCISRGQEVLDNHELDPMKECYCGRPNRNLRKAT